ASAWLRALSIFQKAMEVLPPTSRLCTPVAAAAARASSWAIALATLDLMRRASIDLQHASASALVACAQAQHREAARSLFRGLGRDGGGRAHGVLGIQQGGEAQWFRELLLRPKAPGG
ncbi:unnamed protein product, partial [Symbiodinium pilosum]